MTAQPHREKAGIPVDDDGRFATLRARSQELPVGFLQHAPRAVQECFTQITPGHEDPRAQDLGGAVEIELHPGTRALGLGGASEGE